MRCEASGANWIVATSRRPCALSSGHVEHTGLRAPFIAPYRVGESPGAACSIRCSVSCWRGRLHPPHPLYKARCVQPEPSHSPQCSAVFATRAAAAGGSALITVINLDCDGGGGCKEWGRGQGGCRRGRRDGAREQATQRATSDVPSSNKPRQMHVA